MDGLQETEMYHGLRRQVLSLTAEKLGRELVARQLVAVLMETGLPEGVATLVCVADGATSLYYSNGGGTIGCGEYEPVRLASRDFLDLATSFTDTMNLANSFPLPSEGLVKFYVVTNEGVLESQAFEVDDLGNMRATLSPLFQKGHEVISAILSYVPR
jgi:hypothetical protein